MLAVLLVRSKADPSIIAAVDPKGRGAIKIKTSDTPYPGEHGVGTRFNYAPHLWQDTEEGDEEALAAFNVLISGRVPPSNRR